MKKFYQFEFNGEVLGEDCYGHGKDDSITTKTYLQELADIAKQYSNAKTGNILEWGSGITSLMLADFLHERKFGDLLTIDHNTQYLEAVCAALAHKDYVTALSIDTVGPRESQSDICLNYSSAPLHFNDQFDLIFIDGRRRVECALTAAIISHESTVVAVHDYRRYRYQHMRALFDIISDSPHFRVMRVKPNLQPILKKELENIANSTNTNSGVICKSFSGKNWINIVNTSNFFSGFF